MNYFEKIIRKNEDKINNKKENIKNSNNYSDLEILLYIMCSGNREERVIRIRILKFLIENNTDVNKVVEGNIRSSTAIIEASRNRENGLIRILLVYGDANVNIRDSNGDTPFIIACRTANKRLINMLIEENININNINNIGETSINILFHLGRNDLIKRILIRFLKKYKKYITNCIEDKNEKKNFVKDKLQDIYNKELKNSIKYKNIKMVKFMFEGIINVCSSNLINSRIFDNEVILNEEINVDVNEKDEYGIPILFYAIQDYNIMDYLLSQGANINVTNSDGDTLLFLACSQNSFPSIKYLVDHGADINRGNCYETTPLIISCLRGYEYIIYYLVENGANVNAIDIHYKKTPLIILCENNNANCVSYLIEHGADVNKVDEDGCTPLMYSCKLGNEDMVRYLVEHKADKSIVNKNRETALSIAEKNGHENIVVYLTDGGA